MILLRLIKCLYVPFPFPEGSCRAILILHRHVLSPMILFLDVISVKRGDVLIFCLNFQPELSHPQKIGVIADYES